MVGFATERRSSRRNPGRFLILVAFSGRRVHFLLELDLVPDAAFPRSRGGKKGSCARPLPFEAAVQEPSRRARNTSRWPEASGDFATVPLPSHYYPSKSSPTRYIRRTYARFAEFYPSYTRTTESTSGPLFLFPAGAPPASASSLRPSLSRRQPVRLKLP